MELLSWKHFNPGIDRFLVQQDQLIYPIAKFAGETEEVGRHVAVRKACGAALIMRISQCHLLGLRIVIGRDG